MKDSRELFILSLSENICTLRVGLQKVYKSEQTKWILNGDRKIFLPAASSPSVAFAVNYLFEFISSV